MNPNVNRTHNVSFVSALSRYSHDLQIFNQMFDFHGKPVVFGYKSKFFILILLNTQSNPSYSRRFPLVILCTAFHTEAQ